MSKVSSLAQSPCLPVFFRSPLSVSDFASGQLLLAFIRDEELLLGRFAQSPTTKPPPQG
ncbi:MAG: hypothetical protein HN531_15675 [Opitutae bacterium]|nr:hypothetical protein [Opitutae bacterium]